MGIEVIAIDNLFVDFHCTSDINGDVLLIKGQHSSSIKRVSVLVTYEVTFSFTADRL